MDMKRLEEILSAVTFAEAGEAEKAIEILKERKTILVAVSEMMFDRNALTYAVSISNRIGADIDILYLTKSDKKNPYLEEFRSEIKKGGVKCTVVTREGCMKKLILDYTEKRTDILFVIVGSAPELEIECKTGETALSDAWEKLRCPLVVVSKGEMPSVA